MATYIKVCCPTCRQAEVKKNGKTRAGKQRYLCQNHNCDTKTFLLSQSYIYNGCKPGIEAKILSQTLRAGGIRDVSKTLKVSCVKVINTINTN